MTKYDINFENAQNNYCRKWFISIQLLFNWRKLIVHQLFTTAVELRIVVTTLYQLICFFRLLISRIVSILFSIRALNRFCLSNFQRWRRAWICRRISNEILKFDYSQMKISCYKKPDWTPFFKPKLNNRSRVNVFGHMLMNVFGLDHGLNHISWPICCFMIPFVEVSSDYLRPSCDVTYSDF